MIRLYLARHAKSSWQDEGVPDVKRPLNRRGQHDAPVMGKRLAARGVRPDRMIVSPALRAMTTAGLLAEGLGFPAKDITTDDRVYDADAEGLLEVVRGFDDRWQSVLLLGHNPAVTDLANVLTDELIDNVPTCGILEIVFEGARWRDAAPGGGELVKFDFPKRHD